MLQTSQSIDKPVSTVLSEIIRMMPAEGGPPYGHSSNGWESAAS